MSKITRGQRLENRQQNVVAREKEGLQKKRAKEKERRKALCRKQKVVCQRKREASRKKLRAIKDDKELHEKYKEKERARYHRRKAEGKFKSRDEMTERELRDLRKRRKKSNQKYREKKKQDQNLITQANTESTPNPSDSTSNLSGSTKHTESKKHSLGRKKIVASRSAVHRKLAKQIEENQKLKKALWKAQKKAWRAKQAILLSPKSKVNKDLKGKKVSSEVRRKLIFGEVLQRQVKQSMNLQSIKEKQIAYRIFSGSLVSHYRLKKALGLSSSMMKKYHQKKNVKLLEHQRSERKDKVQNSKKVQPFFVSEKASIESPDKKSFKIQFGKKKIKKPKRYLKGSLKDLYVSYCESEQAPVSYTKFCTLKPFFVVAKNLSERDTCLCEKCENMQLKISALSKAKAIEITPPLALIRSMCCVEKNDKCYQRKCPDCMTKGIPFKDCDEEKTVNCFKWVKITEERQDDKTGKVKKVKRTIKKKFEKKLKSLNPLVPTVTCTSQGTCFRISSCPRQTTALSARFKVSCRCQSLVVRTGNFSTPPCRERNF